MENNGIKIVIVLGLAAAAFGLYSWLGGSGPQVMLANGRTVSGDDIRTPIRAGLVANKAPGMVLFTLTLLDGQGQAIRGVSLSGGKKPDAKVTIIDERGTLLHSGTFRYG